MSDRRQAGASGLALAGLLERRNHADVGGECRARCEPRRMADLGDDARRAQRTDAGRQRAPAADAGAPPHLLWRAAAPGGRRRQLRQSRQPAPGQAKACGVRDMAFHKKAGLAIEDMVRSRWVYRKLRNFRTGIEADISCLKRAYGLARCTWRGLDRFRAYVWSAVIAYNLALLARLKPA
jgi:hypothetical protein